MEEQSLTPLCELPRPKLSYADIPKYTAHCPHCGFKTLHLPRGKSLDNLLRFAHTKYKFSDEFFRGGEYCKRCKTAWVFWFGPQSNGITYRLWRMFKGVDVSVVTLPSPPVEEKKDESSKPEPT